MLKLHGMVVSNFCNIVKQVLLERNIPFEEVPVMPNQEPAYLQISPMGKIPALETPQGFLTETSVIIDYLEEAYPGSNLYPADPFEKAKVRQLIKMVELYIEMPAHSMVGALFGQPAQQWQIDTVKPTMQRGLAALQKLAKFSPWLRGEQFTYADIFVYHAFSVVGAVGGRIYDWDAIGEVPGLKGWLERSAQRPIARDIDAQTNKAMAALLKQQQG